MRRTTKTTKTNYFGLEEGKYFKTNLNVIVFSKLFAVFYPITSQNAKGELLYRAEVGDHHFMITIIKVEGD